MSLQKLDAEIKETVQKLESLKKLRAEYEIKLQDIVPYAVFDIIPHVMTLW